MNSKLPLLAVAAGLLGTCAAVQAQQSNVVKAGITRYDAHSRTSGISGVGVPAGADAEVGDATTVVFIYERMFTPQIGLELVLGIPPRIKSRATGSVAFLGDDVLSARNVAPTLLLNYHFGQPGDPWRPYLGIGANYTKFVGVRSSLATDVKLGDSTGLALTGGLEYALNKDWGLFASVTKLDVKSKLVASGSTVLTTTIDFRPIVYTFGAAYRF